MKRHVQVLLTFLLFVLIFYWIYMTFLTTKFAELMQKRNHAIYISCKQMQQHQHYFEAQLLPIGMGLFWCPIGNVKQVKL